MIKSFKSPETARIWQGERSGRIDTRIQNLIRRKLVMIDAAETLDALRFPPGNHLEALKGDRKGQYSIRVNEKYRVCFKWEAGDAYNLEVVDYH